MVVMGREFGWLGVVCILSAYVPLYHLVSPLRISVFLNFVSSMLVRICNPIKPFGVALCLCRSQGENC